MKVLCLCKLTLSIDRSSIEASKLNPANFFHALRTLQNWAVKKTYKLI